MSQNQMIRYVVFRGEENFWVAQGLELDICAQGKSAEEAMEMFGATVRCEEKEARNEGRNLFDIGKAPENFFLMWNRDEVVSEHLKVA